MRVAIAVMALRVPQLLARNSTATSTTSKTLRWLIQLHRWLQLTSTQLPWMPPHFLLIQQKEVRRMQQVVMRQSSLNPASLLSRVVSREATLATNQGAQLDRQLHRGLQDPPPSQSHALTHHAALPPDPWAPHPHLLSLPPCTPP